MVERELATYDHGHYALRAAAFRITLAAAEPIDYERKAAVAVATMLQAERDALASRVRVLEEALGITEGVKTALEIAVTSRGFPAKLRPAMEATLDALDRALFKAALTPPKPEATE